MRLRQRLGLLLTVVGGLPLIVVGWVVYAGTVRTVQDMVVSQAGLGAQRFADELRRDFQPHRASLVYFAENTETLRILGLASPLTPGARDQLGTLDPAEHLERTWESFGGPFRSLEVLSNADRPVASFERARFIDRMAGASVTIREPIRDPETGTVVGSIRVQANVGSILPALPDLPIIGTSGQLFMVERSTGIVIHHNDRTQLGRLVANVLTESEEEGFEVLLRESQNQWFFRAAGERGVAVSVDVPLTPWVIVSTASIEEFVGPLERRWRWTLLVVLGIAGLTMWGGGAAMRESMRSLEQLTEAAVKISDGDLSPDLPSARSDEVGTLAGAFQVMVDRIETMVRNMERSRQLAAVGEFASQVAHEIRNPLTAIRVNLQALRRATADSPLERKHGRSLDISLDQVTRLERVTRGILSLGHEGHRPWRSVRMHPEIRAAVALLEWEFRSNDVALSMELNAPVDSLRGDAESLRGAVANLLLNASAAAPPGSRVVVRTEIVEGDDTGPARRGSSLRIHVIDEGPGVPADLRDRIFQPFVTTKSEGSGFGLAIALRSAESHGGTLFLQDPVQPDVRLETESDPGHEPRSEGAHFVLELPLTQLNTFDPETRSSQ